MPRLLSLAACASVAAALTFAAAANAQTATSSEQAPPAATEGPAAATSPRGGQETDATTTAPAPVAVVEVDPVLVEVRQQLAGPMRGTSAADRAAMVAFYGERKAAVWVTAAGFTAGARDAMAEIARADDWGLVARAFELPSLAPGDSAPNILAEAEIKLSLAVLKYANHARGGRLDPSYLSRNFDHRPSLRDPRIVLATVAATETPSEYLRSLHPQHPQFQGLRQALLKARGGSSRGEPAPEAVIRLPSNGPLLKPGMEHPEVALLRKRLKVPATPGAESVYDPALQSAVADFQRKNGFKGDGVVGARTRIALNGGGETGRPAFGSTEQRLLVNMERWRWMPDDMGEFHVWNNIPEFQTRVIRRGQLIHQARIIVGKPETSTVLFTANMRYVIFGPDWGVPDSIKIKELLPYLRPTQEQSFFGFGGGTVTDTRILERHNLRVTHNGRPVDASQVDWSQVDIRKFNFIQPPGPGNVLGDVKFRFPNKHDIYMHDTPQRDLFEKSVRTFSHGCIRVQNPGRLAEVLLEEDRGWSAAHVRNLMAQGGNNQITLTKTIPVHMTYFTMVVGDDGQVKSFGDVYGHDNRVSAALAGRPMPIEPPPSTSSYGKEDGKRDARQAKRKQQQTANDLFSGLFGN
jgi:murein L,D-transpeptidase YcbB/YkuD